MNKCFIIERIFAIILLLLFMQSESFHMNIRSVNLRNNIKRSFGQFMSTSAAAAASLQFPRGDETTTSIKTPSIPIVAHLYVDQCLIDCLHMRNNLRKSKLLISTKTSNTSLDTLKAMIETKYKVLVNQPYRINYKYTSDTDTVVRPILDAVNIGPVLTHAQEESKSLQLYISGEPGIFPSPDTEGYSLPPADPNETTSFTMVSFFSFHPLHNPEEVMNELYDLWTPMKAFGRVYVAKEGINAQMAIPSNVFEYFQTITKGLPYFTKARFNTDPPVPRDEYLAKRPFRALHIRVRSQIVTDGLKEGLDWTHAGKELTPQEWHDALVQHTPTGTATDAMINQVDTKNTQGEPITILDCRNIYETDVGLFDGARPLNTTSFRDSWVALEEALEGIPKEKPIYTYCTGGIRCVKINAFLEQTLGYCNTYRLQGGIIAYRRELAKEQQQQQQVTLLTQSVLEEDSDQSTSDVEISSPSSSSRNASSSSLTKNLKFKGVNYVFDERIVERISDDILTKCETCGQPNDSFLNCRNVVCNVRFIQCNSCRTAYNGCCCKACEKEYHEDLEYRASKSNANSGNLHPKQLKSSVKNKHMMTASMRKAAAPTPLIINPVTETPATSRGHVVTTATTTTITTNTIAIQTDAQDEYPMMIKSHAQYLDETTNALAAYSEAHSEQEPLLLHTLRAETMRVFTNPASQRMLSDSSQGSFLSFLASMKGPAAKILELGTFTGYSALSLAMNFDAFSRKGDTSDSSSRSSNERHIRTCEIDAQAAGIAERYFQQSPMKDQIELHRLSAQDMINQCKEKQWKFDIVFIDADKKSYISYLQSLLGTASDGSDSILQEDALIIADNTLWKGLVLHETEEWKEFAPDPKHFGTNVNRLHKVAEAMHQFNTFVSHHPSLRSILLPIRDGFTVMQYKRPSPPIATTIAISSS